MYDTILRLYVDYVSRRYSNASVVFDGYEAGPSTNDCTHQRRTGLHSPTVNFEINMVLTYMKHEFLANTINKQWFINLLATQLQDAGCTVLHATGDADVLIVQTTIESARARNTVLVGDDTDLLVLLWYHLRLDDHDVFFAPEPKQRSQTRRVWNVKKAKNSLGSKVYTNILFIHAILGCDTTSRLYGIGKPLALKKIVEENSIFLEQASVLKNVCALVHSMSVHSIYLFFPSRNIKKLCRYSFLDM